MTKTLTEQWREGTLPDGFYYIKTRWLGCDNKWHYNKEQDIDYLDSGGDWCGVANDSVVEIIGGVPSYDEWKQAKENLDKNGTWYTERSHKELLKQIERLQEQKRKVIALIKDGRFVEALQELENETLA